MEGVHNGALFCSLLEHAPYFFWHFQGNSKSAFVFLCSCSCVLSKDNIGCNVVLRVCEVAYAYNISDIHRTDVSSVVGINPYPTETAELQIRSIKLTSIDTTCVISSSSPMFVHLLESSRRDDSNKGSNIGFGEDIGITETMICMLSGALNKHDQLL